MKKHRRGAFFIRSGHELSPGRSCHARPPGSIGLQGRKPPPTERCPGRMKPALRVADVCNPGRSRGAGEVFLQDQRMVPGRILRSVQQRDRILTGDPADEVAHGRRGAQFPGIPAAELLPPLCRGGMEPCTQPGGRGDLLGPHVIEEMREGLKQAVREYEQLERT